MADVKIYSAIGLSINNAVNTALSGVAGNTIAMLTATILAMTTIYYMIMGYMILAGNVQSPMSDFIKSGIKFMLISSIATGAFLGQDFIGEMIKSMESSITQAWAKTPDEKNSYASLDNTFQKVADKAVELSDYATALNVVNVGGKILVYILALLVFACAVIVTLPAAIMILMANIFLSILIAIAPLFIFCLMFPITSKYFDAWFSNIMTQIFTIALICMVAAVAGHIIVSYSSALIFSAAELAVLAIIKIVVIAMILMWIMFRMGNLAGHLGGGVSSSAITLVGAAAAAGLAAGATKLAGKGLNKLDKLGDNRARDAKGKVIKGEGASGHGRFSTRAASYAYRSGMEKFRSRGKGNTVSNAGA